MTKEAKCKNCGKLIKQYNGGGPWTHFIDENHLSITCEGKSFEGTLAESVERGYAADPVPEGIVWVGDEVPA